MIFVLVIKSSIKVLMLNGNIEFRGSYWYIISIIKEVKYSFFRSCKCSVLCFLWIGLKGVFFGYVFCVGW